MKPIWLNICRNKTNGQIVTSIPKRNLPLSLRRKLNNLKRAKISFEDFEWE